MKRKAKTETTKGRPMPTISPRPNKGKACLLLLFSLFFLLPLHAQTYQQLWSQVEKATDQDKPKSALTALKQIERKATKEKQYGHLFASLFSQLNRLCEISEDSLAPAIARMQAKDRELQRKDRVASIMLHVAMRKAEEFSRTKIDSSGIYDDYIGFGKEGARKSLVAELLADKTVAAQLTQPDGIKAFLPSVELQSGSSYFNHDIISLIAFTLHDYKPLIDYYLHSGNRKAACLTAARMVAKADESEALIAQTDSFISLFSDLSECGELAVERYSIMPSSDLDAENYSEQAGKLIDWIDEALQRWPRWDRMNELRNERTKLTAPILFFNAPSSVIRTSQTLMLSLTQVRNISRLNVSITPIKACPDAVMKKYLDNRKFSILKPYLADAQTRTVEKSLGSHKVYEVFRDSLDLGRLPLGAYHVTILCDGKRLQDSDFVIFVSDLKVINLPLSDKQTRYVVVNATTGKPVPYAKLHISKRIDRKEMTFTTDAKGEYIFNSDEIYANAYATTAEDKLPMASYIWNRFNALRDNKGVSDRESIFTDRGIYRPGQTVHVSVLSYSVANGTESSVNANRKITLRLYDANHNKIAEAPVTTNEYGVASTEFQLPEKTLNGSFFVRGTSGSGSFRVEEYVRPTYEVTIPRPAMTYRQGDTITVKGTAKAYSGVPVGNAKVVYSVKRRESWWWRMSGKGNTTLLSDTVTTDMQGNFELRMPMLMPDEESSSAKKVPYCWWIMPPMFYDIVAEATVTDIAGESHSASLSLPVGNRESVLTSDIKDKMLRDSVNTFTFTRRNQAGTEIKGRVTVSIDGRKVREVEAGEVFTLPRKLSSGKHSLLAVCGKDTLEQSFVLFSMEDKRPAVSTPDWFYVSSDRFSGQKDQPVFVQFGTSKPDSYAVFTVFSNGKVLESGAVRLDSSLVTRKFEYRDEYGDFVNFAVAWVRDGVVYRHSAVISRPLPDKSLNLKWTTFRNRLQPGQKETWTVSVTDKDGKPANANLMATLYDKSLDAIYPFAWNFSDPRGINTASQHWGTATEGQEFHSAMAKLDLLTYNQPCYNCFNSHYIHFSFAMPHKQLLRSNIRVGFAKAAGSTDKNMILMAEESVADFASDRGEMLAKRTKMAAPAMLSSMKMETTTTEEETDIPVREALGETAFFLSDVRTDANGIATLSFTLPESVTTWRFLAFANDKDLRFGMMKDEVVAQKQLMIQPRIPRFLREGDRCSMPATVANLTEKPLDVKVKMLILDAETEQTLYIYNNKVEVKPGESSAVSFDLDSKGLDGKVLIVKYLADAGIFSDGEQHYLPILSSKEMVIDTRTITMPSQSSEAISLTPLLPEKAEKATLSVEYTDAPEWLVIQSLPQIADPSDDNALSLVSAYYANTVAAKISESNPAIEKAVKEWTKDISSLESPLSKNEELHTTILAETPWLLDADTETSQRKQLYRLFDTSLLASRQAFAMKHLKALQLSDGSFSWWKGMEGSRYMTMAVVQTLLRLNTITGDMQSYSDVISKAFAYLDKEVAEDVKWMKEHKRKKQDVYLSSFDLNYLYCRAIFSGKMSASAKANVDFMLDYIVQNTRYLDMQSKAATAIILFHFGKERVADEYLQSVIEHTVYREDMGRYFDSYRASYSWCDYRIPTQVSVIEALRALHPEQRQTITEMQRWLLQSKRTQSWDTPLNAVNAIYAFLGSDTQLRHGMPAKISLGAETLKPTVSVPTLGYEKVSREIGDISAMKADNATDASALKIEKTTDGESWANVYLQYLVPSSEAKSAATGISIQRSLSAKNLRVGDKVTVTITINADRDYDFVTVTDHRPACLEPVNQLSGYRNGCYQVTRDSQTQYHFNMLRKGKHVIKTEYYVSRAGDFTSGTASAQCSYAPEFCGRQGGEKIKILNEK